PGAAGGASNMSQHGQGSLLELQEAQLRRAAREFVYPPTPDIAGAVRQRLEGERLPARRLAPALPGQRRRLAWIAVAATVAVLLVSILAVPEVRAVVQEFLRIGTIRIVPATPTPPGAPTATPVATGGISAYDGIDL